MERAASHFLAVWMLTTLLGGGAISVASAEVWDVSAEYAAAAGAPSWHDATGPFDYGDPSDRYAQLTPRIPAPFWEDQWMPPPRGGAVPMPEYEELPPADHSMLPPLDEDAARIFPHAHDERLLLDAPAPIFSSGSWFWNGNWYTQQEVVMLHRSRADKIPLAVDTSFNLFTEFNTIAASPTYTAGGRITLGYMLGRDRANRDHLVEFTYFGMFDWDARATIVAADSGGITTILGPGNISFAGFNNADLQRYEYTSDLESFELNLRIRSRPGRDRLIIQPDGSWVRHMAPSRIFGMSGGLVYLGISEQFDYTSLTANPADTSGFYRVATYNDMFGVQIGGEAIEQYTEWSAGVRGRMGGLLNFVDRRSRVDRIVSGVPDGWAETLDDETLVFLAELELTGAYQLRPNVALRASYNFLYLTGLAMAPKNLGLRGGGEFPPINMGGDMFLHGAYIGFDMVW